MMANNITEDQVEFLSDLQVLIGCGKPLMLFKTGTLKGTAEHKHIFCFFYVFAVSPREFSDEREAERLVRRVCDYEAKKFANNMRYSGEVYVVGGIPPEWMIKEFENETGKKMLVKKPENWKVK